MKMKIVSVSFGPVMFRANIYYSSKEAILSRVTYPANFPEIVASLGKWRVIQFLLQEYSFPLDDHGSMTCALCQKYLRSLHRQLETCQHCPIALTGFPMCHGTPYESFTTGWGNRDYIAQVYSCKDEIEFLDDLIGHEIICEPRITTIRTS